MKVKRILARKGEKERVWNACDVKEEGFLQEGREEQEEEKRDREDKARRN